MIMCNYCRYENVCKKNMVNIIWCISEHASDIPSSIGPRCLLSVCEHGLLLTLRGMISREMSVEKT